VSTAPSSDQRSRRCPALGPDTLNVMGSDPPVWNSTSPDRRYQSNTSATPSSASATKPSRDMDMIATTLDIERSLRGLATASWGFTGTTIQDDEDRHRAARPPGSATRGLRVSGG